MLEDEEVGQVFSARRDSLPFFISCFEGTLEQYAIMHIALTRGLACGERHLVAWTLVVEAPRLKWHPL